MHPRLSRAITAKYRFRRYSRSYPRMFAFEKVTLSKMFDSIKQKEIFHIGSTSVPGLGGKRVIDVIVVVPKDSVPLAKKLLAKGGFVYHHTLRKKRSFHFKYYVDAQTSPRLVHLHLTYFGSGELDKALAFRDYLRAHPKEKKRYEKVKREASKKYSSDGKKYVAHKLSAVEDLMKKAMKWYKADITQKTP